MEASIKACGQMHDFRLLSNLTRNIISFLQTFNFSQFPIIRTVFLIHIQIFIYFLITIWPRYRDLTMSVINESYRWTDCTWSAEWRMDNIYYHERSILLYPGIINWLSYLSFVSILINLSTQQFFLYLPHSTKMSIFPNSHPIYLSLFVA